jgi:hypothetical protein
MAKKKKRENRPTPKMIALYHFLSRELGGEPEDLWVFDPAEFDDPPPSLRLTNVAVWPADQNCDVTSFHTLGMSERLMKGADYFAELHWAIRASLTKDERLRVAQRLADLAAYPFEHDLKLDWWEVIRQAGPIPQFEGCRHILLHPRFAETGFDEIEHPDGTIKVLYVVPITPQERHLVVDHGREHLENHWVDQETDVLRDRWAPREWYNPNEEYRGPET